MYFLPYKDNRYSRAIKQSLNKAFDNKNTINKHIADLISRFSHSTLITPGAYMLTSGLQYFVVQSLLSDHWVTGFYCPSQLQYFDGLFFHIPNIFRRSVTKRKKLFDPFSNEPFVKLRNLKFFLSKTKDEPMSTFSGILTELH
jgi:hypothetical protein